MKKIILFTILLFSNVAWLAHAAALEPADSQPVTGQHTLFEDIPKEVRAEIIQQALPELVDFLLRRGNNDSARQEIPNFDFLSHTFAISDKYSKLAIGLCANAYNDQNSPGQMIIWDLASNELVQIVDLPHPLRKILITSDEEKIITADTAAHVNIWDAGSLKKLHDLGPCCDPYHSSIALSCDGSKLVTVGEDAIRIWSVQEGKEMFSKAVTPRRRKPSQFAVSPSGEKVVFGFSSCLNDDEGIQIVDVTNHEQPLWINANNPRYIRFGPDGTTIMGLTQQANDSVYCTWNALTGELLSQINHAIYGKKIIGHKRIEFEGYRENRVTIVDDSISQFLCSLYPCCSVWDWIWSYVVTQNWVVATIDNGYKICAWDLKKCVQRNNELIQEIGKLSINKILFLRDKVMKAKYKRVVLNRNNPKHAETIRDYESLPAMIKDRIKDFVRLVDACAFIHKQT